MHRLGIMQGRLSPDPENKIQFFPEKTWEEEFPIASESYFDCMEMTMDFEGFESHPIMTEEGRERLRFLKNKWKIDIPVICCDIFMDAPFFGIDNRERTRNIQILHRIIQASGLAELEMIEIPVISRSTIRSPLDENLLVAAVECSLPLAEKHGVTLLLETDLPPEKFCRLLERLGGRVFANYDTGNSSYFGFDHGEEIRLLNKYIKNVHIKDCKRNEYSVPLGTGDTSFEVCFQAFADIGYRGDFILQTARGQDNVGVAKRYRSFTLEYIRQYLR